jgi:hypothetical protein
MAALSEIFKFLDHTHSNQMGLGWMKFDARYSLQMTVLRFRKSSGSHFNTIDLSSLGRDFVRKHFKIILKDINDFIRLQGFFDSES